MRARFMAVTVLAVTVAACGSHPAVGKAPLKRASEIRAATAAPGLECTTTELRVTFINDQDAAGTAHDDLNFTNRSSSSCFVEGWPGVSYATAKGGRPAGAPARRAPG